MCGSYRHLFEPSQFVHGKEDTAGISARGYFELGNEIIPYALDRIRRQADRCSKLEGFSLFHGIGGGTGSGLSSLLLERLEDDYPKKIRWAFPIYSDKYFCKHYSEPYNSLLACCSLMRHADMATVMDNKALIKLWNKTLLVPFPNYDNLNLLAAHVIISLTAPLRFSDIPEGRPTSLLQKMVLYKRLNHTVASFAPLISDQKCTGEPIVVSEITRDLFQPQSCTTNINLRYGKYLARNIMYQGDVVPRSIRDAIKHIHDSKSIRTVNFLPSEINLNIVYNRPKAIINGGILPYFRTATLLANTTAIAERFFSIAHEFDLLFRNAHI